MKIKFLDLHQQYLSIKDEIDSAISETISKSSFVGGNSIIEFEEQFKTYHESDYCLGVGNGTDALEISLEALNLPVGSEIIVPANSFISSAEAISRNNFKVVFCDVSPIDYNIDLDDLKKRITKNTSAIIAVHLYGQPCQIKEIIEIANNHSLKVVEDCAQAHGAEYEGKKVGTFGDLGCFSFYPGKNLGAFGDAGAIITNDQKLYFKCKKIANHGRIAKYDHEFEGRNSRLDGIQAAILSVKLNHLEEWTKVRIQTAMEYINQLSDIDEIKLPNIKENVRHVFHLFVVRSHKRDAIREKLSNAGIETGIHYPIALPKLKAFKYLNQGDEDGFAWISDRELFSLPIHGNFDLNQIKYIKENL